MAGETKPGEMAIKIAVLKRSAMLFLSLCLTIALHSIISIQIQSNESIICIHITCIHIT